MPKMPCECGEWIDLSPIPNPSDFKILWEPNIEELIEKLVMIHKEVESEREFATKAFRAINPLTGPNPHALECPGCGRLGFLARPSDSTVKLWYRRDANNETHQDKQLRSLFRDEA